MKREEGVGLVEAVISGLFFFLLVIGLFELLILGYKFATTQYFVSSILRIETLRPAGATLADVKSAIQFTATRYGLDIKPEDVKIQASEDGDFAIEPCDPPVEAQGIGLEGDYLSMCVTQEYSLLLGVYKLPLRFVVFGRKEPQGYI